METIRHPENECPRCKHMVDAASPIGNEMITVKKDDIAVCAYCGNFNQYNEDLSLRTMTRETLNEIKEHQPDAYNKMRQLQEIITSRL